MLSFIVGVVVGAAAFAGYVAARYGVSALKSLFVKV